jgi:hypothetical protein
MGGVTKVEVEVTDQDGMCPHGARAPGLVNILQIFQIGGGNIKPNDI